MGWTTRDPAHLDFKKPMCSDNSMNRGMIAPWCCTTPQTLRGGVLAGACVIGELQRQQRRPDYEI
ncbi:hypothetical protein MRX62_13595 (plasmid) [Xylella fastidiosa subsp. pauca]|uniref:hypothetical protein n=1 Tax=Xylella fastidiosa TaxID=2371 RepID=UPI003A6E6E49